MCYNVKQTSSIEDLLKRFKAKKGAQSTLDFTTADEVSGFVSKAAVEGNKVRVITNDCPEDIQVFRWGLIPENARDMSISGGNLNAKLETLEDRKSFAGSVDNRCLILVDGFYEHKHLSKHDKLKHLITTSDGKPFAFAGIWRDAIAPNGERIQSCAIITMKAEGIMVDIHNNPDKEEPRMPVLLKPGKERDWLEMDLLTFRSELITRINLDLTAIALRDYQASLF